MGSDTERYSQVVLVDDTDQETGTMEKMEAHKQGRLHRAVAVFIFNRKGEWLLQRRTAFKYHSGGLWSNTCSTHPYPGEVPDHAARRRLAEEMGLNCSLEKVFCFTYHAPVDRGLSEHEYEHIFVGYTDDLPDVNPTEVWDWTFLSSEVLLMDEQAHPEKYTVWFRSIYKNVMQSLYNRGQRRE